MNALDLLSPLLSLRGCINGIKRNQGLRQPFRVPVQCRFQRFFRFARICRFACGIRGFRSEGVNLGYEIVQLALYGKDLISWCYWHWWGLFVKISLITMFLYNYRPDINNNDNNKVIYRGLLWT